MPLCYHGGMPVQQQTEDVPEGVELYDWEDYGKTRDLVFNDAKDALVKQFPKEYNGVRMELSDVDYYEKDDYSITDQKKALLNDDYLGRRLRGKVKLFDTNTGELLDERSMTLMKVPYMTDRGTFIREGNEWGVIAQQRLVPGAYSRYQKNGDLETQFNVRPGTGKAFRVSLNPESAQYKFAIAGSELHLYSLLHDIGVSDEEIKDTWGDDVFNANKNEYDSRVFEKAYNKIVPEWDRKKNPARSREDKIKLIKDALDRSQVATSVVKKTLPNLFDREKSAEWKEYGPVFAKLASMNRGDLEDVANYINASAEKEINTDAPKPELLRQIRNTVITGLPEGDASVGKVDPKDTAAALVRNMHAQRAMSVVLSKIKS